MKKIKLIKILAGFFALMLLFTFLSRAADSVNVAQVETKTAQNQVITHEVTGTGKVMGTRERAVFTQGGPQIFLLELLPGPGPASGSAPAKMTEGVAGALDLLCQKLRGGKVIFHNVQTPLP